MESSFRTVVVLPAHTDDGTMGCGRAIACFGEEGRDVYHADFSIAHASVRPDFPDGILATEAKAVPELLCIPAERLFLRNFQVRHFLEHREAIDPALILVPSSDDVHQDHQIIVTVGSRASKLQTILAYDEPWNNIVFETRCLIVLEEHIRTEFAGTCLLRKPKASLLPGRRAHLEPSPPPRDANRGRLCRRIQGHPLGDQVVGCHAYA